MYHTKKSYIDNRFFVYGMVMLNIALYINYMQPYYGISSVIKYITIVTALVFFIRDIVLSGVSTRFRTESPAIFLYFFLRILLLLLFSISLTPSFLQKMLVTPTYFLPYVFILFALLTEYNLQFFKKLFVWSYYFVVVGLLIKVFILIYGINYEYYFEISSVFMITNLASAILLMNAHLFENKNILRFSLLNWVLGLVIIALLGRRGGTLNIVYVLIAYFLILFFSDTKSNSDKNRYFAILVGLIILLAASLPYLEQNVYVFQRGFNQQGWDESRGTVIDSFFNDFKSQSDFLWGRGLNGQVDRGLFDVERADNVENGFLTILLKGGISLLLPMLYFFMRAIYLGFFKSNNDLIKSLAFVIVIYVLNMLSYGLPEASTAFLLVWIAVACCLSPMLRNYTNNDLKLVFNNR